LDGRSVRGTRSDGQCGRYWSHSPAGGMAETPIVSRQVTGQRLRHLLYDVVSSRPDSLETPTVGEGARWGVARIGDGSGKRREGFPRSEAWAWWCHRLIAQVSCENARAWRVCDMGFAGAAFTRRADARIRRPYKMRLCLSMRIDGRVHTASSLLFAAHQVTACYRPG